MFYTEYTKHLICETEFCSFQNELFSKININLDQNKHNMLNYMLI